MKVFSSLDDALSLIRGSFCLGGRGFKTPMVDQECNNGRVSVWITCGIPGTGKTTLSETIRNAYPPYSCAVVSRDEIRTDLLWDSRKLDRKTQKLQNKWMDRMTSWEVQERLARMLDDPKKHWNGIVVDGCHTDANTLENLLEFLNQYENRIIVHLIIVGDEDSPCFHAINDRKEGDYSDYGPHGHHQSLPHCVVQRKREEMKDLLENHLNCIVPHVDDVFWIRECAGRPAFSKSYREYCQK